MIHVTITLLDIIIFIIAFYYFKYIVYVLDKKTKYKDDMGMKIKYLFMFMYGGVFCLFFIDKIKEKRKIDYFKYVVLYRNEKIKRFGEEIYDNDTLNEHNNMKRYLKLKKVKKEIKWKQLKEMVSI